MPGKLRVANLSRTADGPDLEALFAPHGTVRSTGVSTDPASRSGGTGVGRVEMGSDAEAEAAIAALNGRPYRGSILEVGWAVSSHQTDPVDSEKSSPWDIPNEAGAHGSGGPAPGDFGDRGGSYKIPGGDGSGDTETI